MYCSVLSELEIQIGNRIRTFYPVEAVFSTLSDKRGFGLLFMNFLIPAETP